MPEWAQSVNGRMAVKVLHLHLPDEDYHAGRLLPVLPLFPPHLPLPLHLLLLLMTSMMTATTVKKKIMVTAMMMMMMLMPMMVDLVPGAFFSPMLLHCGQERRSEFTSVEHYDISCT